jgi:5,10-methylenetetrahydrofolate reductase
VTTSSQTLLHALQSGQSVISAELRPPRAELNAADGMNAWIDTYHAVRGLTRQQTYVFLTDSAVGAAEEDNLRHLVTNLGQNVPRERVVPFLTCKHPLTYCLSYAERARQHGFRGLVVLGGDRHVGPVRCFEHAWQLRQAIREREPELHLGGWANPNADAERQVDYLLDPKFTAEFYLTQIVSHHQLAPVERFITEGRRRDLALPGIFGVFYYRSASPRTLATLSGFLPVPIEDLTREFGAGASANDVCARSVRALMDVGARHFYISNLPLGRASSTLAAFLERVGGAHSAPAKERSGRGGPTERLSRGWGRSPD